MTFCFTFSCWCIHFFSFSSNHKGYFDQAYTNELENKVSRLEEENERLRKQKVGFLILFMLFCIAVADLVVLLFK